MTKEFIGAEKLQAWLTNVASVYDRHTTNDCSVFYSCEYNTLENIIENSSNIEVKCCRCGKMTMFYSIAPYGSKDDGDPICAKCIDSALGED